MGSSSVCENHAILILLGLYVVSCVILFDGKLDLTLIRVCGSGSFGCGIINFLVRFVGDHVLDYEIWVT